MKITNKEKINFIYNSNMIEGINFPIELYYNNDLHSNGFYEISNHLDALDYVLNNYNKSLTEKRILKIHNILMKNILDLDNVGKYRKCNVTIGGSYGTLPIAIRQEMKQLIKLINKCKTIEHCWNCHHEFEVIHPFVDGNGRTGRLMLNWLLLKNKHKFETIKHTQRADYYALIKKYRFDKILMWSIDKN